MTSTQWDGLALVEADVARLAAAAAHAPDSGLVVVTCPVGAVADAAGVTLAQTRLGPGSPAEDLHVARPESGTWTVAELAEQVQRPAGYMPAGSRCVIVVCAADRMDRRAADFLLTTVESPAPGVLFVFCCADENALAVTVRSRAVCTVRLGLPDQDVVADRLSGAGIAAGPRAAVMAVSSAALAEALLDPVRGMKVAEFLREACAEPDWSRPYTTASTLAQNLAAVAWAITGRPQADAATRAVLRELAGVWITTADRGLSGPDGCVHREITVAARDACALIGVGVAPQTALVEFCLTAASALRQDARTTPSG